MHGTRLLFYIQQTNCNKISKCQTSATNSTLRWQDGPPKAIVSICLHICNSRWTGRGSQRKQLSQSPSSDGWCVTGIVLFHGTCCVYFAPTWHRSRKQPEEWNAFCDKPGNESGIRRKNSKVQMDGCLFVCRTYIFLLFNKWQTALVRTTKRFLVFR